MTEILNITVPGNPEYIQIVKMAAGAAAAVEGYDIEKIDDIKLAIAEGCKAITCHGFTGWSENYNVKLSTVDKQETETATDGAEALIIEIEDEKCIHPVEKRSHPCLDCPREGDLGIQIMKSIMDDVEIIRSGDGCRRIRMVKNK